jgi:hypothetical protein
MNMFIETQKTLKLFKRESKLGVCHTVRRNNIMYIFKCDTCGDTFKQPKNSIDPDRIKKVHKHFCKKCEL